MSTILTNPLAVPPDTGAAIDSAAANAAASATASANSGSASGSTSADTLSTEFLQLLIAQLQNQDPENPADGTTFVTQLAQFTSVGQEAQSATDLGSILSLLQQSTAPAASVPGSTPTTPASSGSGNTPAASS